MTPWGSSSVAGDDFHAEGADAVTQVGAADHQDLGALGEFLGQEFGSGVCRTKDLFCRRRSTQLIQVRGNGSR